MRLGLAGLGLAVTLAAIGVSVPRQGWRELVWLVPGLLGCLPLLFWAPVRAGRLRLDAQGWSLAILEPRARDEQAGELALAVDAGDWMLLSFRGHGAGLLERVWLVLGSRHVSADWCAVRRAVFSPRPAPAGSSVQALADPPA